MTKLLVGMIVAGAAWWIVGLPPFSAAATVAVVGAGTAAVGVGVVTRPATRPPPRPIPGRWLAAWAALAVVAGGWQLAAYLQGPRDDHPTLSSLANVVLSTHMARAAAFVLWLAGAFALARR